jgi:DNA-binding CsgD family transcriptional regulator
VGDWDVVLGRKREIDSVAALLGDARAGRGGSLVIRGDPGIGKTVLLERSIEAAGGFRVIRATGSEFEAELAYAGLQQLCAPLIDLAEQLPEHQRAAIETVLGRRADGVPDPLLVGLAVLTLFSEATEDQPLLGVVDDAQWLDHATSRALAFAARRIEDERVALVFAQREGTRATEIERLPELRLGPLSGADSHALLESALQAPLDQRVRERVLAEARGNPLSILELTLRISPTELAGGFSVAGSESVSIEDLYRRRLAELPDDTQMLLLVAAAEPLGDVLLLWAAADRLGINQDALAPAEAAGLLEVDAGVRFRHPLVRSAIYRSTPPRLRRAAHAVLGEVTDPQSEPDRRAWHRGVAAARPDEQVASELVDSAQRAQARGGNAAAAAFLERAAALTPDPGARVSRTQDAAEAKLAAGAPDEAQTLLEGLVRESMTEPQLARSEVLMGLIAFNLRRGAEAPPLLRQAAGRLEALDVAIARETHLDAVYAALAAGSLGQGVDEVASTALGAPPAPDSPTTVDLLLDGIGGVLAGQRGEATPLLRRALSDPEDPVWTTRPSLLALVAIELWDMETYETTLRAQIARARRDGALTVLPHALGSLSGALVPQGRFREAEEALDESQALSEATGTTPMNYNRMHLAAFRGQARRTAELADVAISDATDRGEALLVSFAHYSTSLLLNGRADYEGALAAAQRTAQPLDFSWEGIRLRELIEAAAHCGERRIATDAYGRIRERSQVTETDWGLGNEFVCAALVSEGALAEGHFRAAIDHLEHGQIRADLERARLLYGEWLRREGRRIDAREQLRNAHDALLEMGAEGFAERAARELAATGERARRRTTETLDDLTPQEMQIARLVATGATSKEVAGELFISPRTVDAHLRSIFRKLGLSSRRELRGLRLEERMPA